MDINSKIMDGGTIILLYGTGKLYSVGVSLKILHQEKLWL